MAASYLLVTRPTRNFAEIGLELAELPRILIKRFLSLTFLGLTLSLLLVSGIAMFFYDLGFFYNINHRFGMTSIGISSLVLVLGSITILTLVFVIGSPRKRSDTRIDDTHYD